MKLLFFASCLLAVAASPIPYGYNINDYLDDAVEEFNTKVLKAGDEYAALDDPISIGGFVLTRPMLADMSSLERVGDALLVPLQNSVEIRAKFKFGKMHLDGRNLTGPGKAVEKPRISIRNNLVEVTFKGVKQTSSGWLADGQRTYSKSCVATYESHLIQLFNVALVTSSGITPLDPWVDGLMSQIEELMNPYLNSIFEGHFDLCASLKKNGYMW